MTAHNPQELAELLEGLKDYVPTVIPKRTCFHDWQYALQLACQTSLYNSEEHANLFQRDL